MALLILELVVVLLQSGLIEKVVALVQRQFPDAPGPVKKQTALQLLMASYGQVTSDTRDAEEAVGIAIDLKVAALRATEFEDEYGTRFKITQKETHT